MNEDSGRGNRDILLCVLMGAATGALSGLTGVGGAVIMVPTMVGFLSVSQHKAHGTSLTIISITALAAGVQYARQGYLDIGLAAQLAAGSIVGAVVGAKLMAKVPAKQLKRGFGLLLITMGLRMIVR